MTVRFGCVAGAIAVLLAGCRTSPGAETGTYSATLTGAVDTTFSGRAEWERGAGLDEFEFAVHMLLPGKGPEFGILLFFRERPERGVYPVVNRSPSLLLPGEVAVGAVVGQVFAPGSGQVRITSSRPFRGTFDVAEAGPGQAQPLLRIQGEFALE